MRSWEGIQLAGLTQTSQVIGIFDTMWHQSQYLTGGAGQRRVITAWERAGHQVMRKLDCVLFVLYIIFIGIIVAIFFFLCCSAKRFLSQYRNFAFFLWFPSPRHQRGGATEQLHGSLFLAGAKSRHNLYCVYTAPSWGGQLSQTSPGQSGQLSQNSILRNW